MVLMMVTMTLGSHGNKLARFLLLKTILTK